MSKKPHHFKPMSKPKPVSEEDTPHMGTTRPVTTEVEANHPLPGEDAVKALARDLAAVDGLKEKIKALENDLDVERALHAQAVTDLQNVRHDLTLALRSREITDQDLEALRGMFAEITFERSRNGDHHVIVLKGKRGFTGGKVYRFATFDALLAHLRK